MPKTTLRAGMRLGPYEIEGSLGSGAMGTVYRARDPKLKRDVAVKVLPEEFAQNADAVARFQREAEALASLNHLNIGAIYDIAESEGSRYLVLELIEGVTLAERIARGPIPVDEALEIARQIAEALEAAHEKGVIHRDLKPANVKLTPAGVVKVLDFGLAKVQTAESTADISTAPTLAAESIPGMILGTAAYMAPEQAKGRKTDRTSDIWSFGCVLYEMLTGRPVFEGETVSETLAEVLKSEPSWEGLPAETPEGIRRLLQRCLRKDRKTRLRDIGDARIEIAEARSAPPPDRALRATVRVSRLRERFGWALVAIAALVAGGSGVWLVHRPVVPQETHVDIATAPTFSAVSLAISPDGRKIAYVAEAEGRSQLWVRSLDSASARVLAGTNNSISPFWAPDNRSLGFFADAKLKVIDTESDSVRVLASAPNSRGGTWSQDGVILFVPFTPGVVHRMPAAGGKPEPVTWPVGGEAQATHVFPQFLPDGKHFLYFVQGSPERQGVYVSALDAGAASKPMRLLEAADSSAVYVSSGHLLFVKNGNLVAQPFDAQSLSVSGSAFTVAESIAGGLSRGAISASPAGAIVYRSIEAPAASMPAHFAWFDRMGRELAPFDNPLGLSSHWSLSLDGRSFAQERSANGNVDIWRLDLSRGLRSQVTTDPVSDTFPVLSADGQHIIFTSSRKGPTFDLYTGLVDKPGSEALLLESTENKIATDRSADGRFLLYRNFSSDTGYDIWALPLDSDGNRSGEPVSVVRTPADERDGQFSPDGKWVAYQSNDTGFVEIYVQPFPPGPGAKYLVSRGGGSQVRWNRNGRELLYVALDGRLMSVPIRFDSSQQMEAGAPAPLFLTSLRGGEVQSPNRQQYAISPDGLRILMRADSPAPNTLPIALILNWKPKP